MNPTIDELRSRLILESETGLLTWRPLPDPKGWQVSWNNRCAGKPALNHESKRGYFNGSFSNRTLYAHRVVWALHYGEWPKDQIDHINGNPKDNRVSNLRVADQKTNSRNMRKSSRNKSGFIGVHWHGQTEKWTAQIRSKGKTIHLGVYDELNDAAHARKSAEAKYGYHKNHGR